MAAPKQNKFWELRSKHGRDAIFSDPVLLWTEACKYFEWSAGTPLIEVEQTKSPFKPMYDKKKEKWIIPSPLVKMPKMRAFTMNALCLHLDVHSKYFTERKEALKDKNGKPKNKAAAALLEVIDRIESVIYVQKFEGAAAGLLSGNIISRELGLVDKQDQKVDSTQKVEFNGKVEVKVKNSGVPFGDNPSDGS